MSAHCLNCDTPLQGSFCHKCGQKSSTHRITFSQFIKHDLIHGVFHLDKGILYTLKSLLYSPGYAARDFLKGKRVMHYNIFALFIIVVALKTLLDLQISPDGSFYSYEEENKHTDEIINGSIRHYYKLFYLLIIPLLSCFSSILLRKLHYNFVEHLVFNSFLLAGGFFYALIFSVAEYLLKIPQFSVYGLFFIVLYVMVGYYQGTKGVYKFINYIWRACTILVLFLSSLFLILALIIQLFYQGSFEGQISI